MLPDLDLDSAAHRSWLQTAAALLATPYMAGREADIVQTMIGGMNECLERSLADGLVSEWEAEGRAARFRRAAESLRTWPTSILVIIAHLPPEARFFNPSWFDYTDPEAIRFPDLEALDR